MRNLNLSAVTPSVGFPPKSGTWDFLQMAYKECIDAMIQAQIGNGYSTSKGYVLYGCELTSGLGWSVSAGAIYFNGELYISPAQGGTAGVGTFLVNLAQTQYTGTDADPVLFTDSVARDVHDIIQISYGYGTSGTGTVCDFVDLQRLDTPFESTVSSLAGDTIYLTHSKFKVYLSALTGAVGFTIDFTDAKRGAEVIIQTGISGTPTITISDGGAVAINQWTPPASLAGCSQITYTFKYLGKAGATHWYTQDAYAS